MSALKQLFGKNIPLKCTDIHIRKGIWNISLYTLVVHSFWTRDTYFSSELNIRSSLKMKFDNKPHDQGMSIQSHARGSLEKKREESMQTEDMVQALFFLFMMTFSHSFWYISYSRFQFQVENNLSALPITVCSRWISFRESQSGCNCLTRQI